MRLRRFLVAGLLIWLPVGVTILVFKVLLDLMDELLFLVPVSYQPPPFNLKTGAEIRRRSVSLPHSGHLRSGESLIFCSASSSCEQLPQRYS